MTPIPALQRTLEGIKLEFNSRRKSRTYTNSQRLNNMLLNNDLVIEKEKFKVLLESHENENRAFQIYGIQ